MKILKFTLGVLAALICGTSSLSAQESEISVSGGADVVSSYVWRGAYQTGASIQPYASISGYGFTIGAWGSSPIAFTLNPSGEPKEIDYYVSYSIGGLTATVTDYWWEGTGANYFGAGHYYEASLAYTICEDFPLAVAVNTFIGGENDRDNGSQLYSTYVSVSYPFTINDVDCSVAVGGTPAKGYYGDPSFCSISARASKSIEVSETFSLPVFVEGIANPVTNDGFFVFGTSIAF